jgi:N-acetylglucosamine kinase-like BadF-type ATPase
MNHTILIADSGGTQTDWCFVDKEKEKHIFSTKSFHPSNWGSSFFEEFSEYWTSKSEMKEAHVFFYGAGCLNEDNKQVISTYFARWGFKHVHVYSDLLGACHALLGKNQGTVAILGTGSVVCHFNGSEITEIQGGLGYLLGDEGSGYFFGKILITKFLKGDFEESTMNLLSKLLGNRSEIMSKVYGEHGKSYLSSLALQVKGVKGHNLEIEKCHYENINNFLKISLSNSCSNITDVYVVGSYGYFNQEILKKILATSDINLIKCIQYPIRFLSDFVIDNADSIAKRSI